MTNIDDLTSQLRAQGADPRTLAEFEQEVSAGLIAELDERIRCIGKILVERGHRDLWREAYVVAFNRETEYRTDEDLDFLTTGRVG